MGASTHLSTIFSLSVHARCRRMSYLGVLLGCGFPNIPTSLFRLFDKLSDDFPFYINLPKALNECSLSRFFCDWSFWLITPRNVSEKMRIWAVWTRTFPTLRLTSRRRLNAKPDADDTLRFVPAGVNHLRQRLTAVLTEKSESIYSDTVWQNTCISSIK